MSTGFVSIRNEMAMNYRGTSSRFSPSDETSREIERVLDIWNASLTTSPGPYLFGDFSIADCMYVPVLSRFRTYGVALQGQVAGWEARIWEHPSVAKWTMLAEKSVAIPKYDSLL